MAIEIERRFIVQGEKWKDFAQKSYEIKQGYLITEKNGWTTRVRIINNQKAVLTLKYPKEELTRYEFEYMVPLNDAEELFKIAKYSLIKTRYELHLNHNLWIVDCFKEKNFPLVVAEIELESLKEVFEKPNWCRLEISNLQELSNSSLAKLPISSWPLDKRRIFL